MAEESDKFEFLLEQMADLRATVGTNSVPTQSTLELQQKLDKALSDNASLRTQVSKTESEMNEIKNRSSNESLRMNTIERQLFEAVAARDSNQQVIKQKCDEIEKLKIILHSTVKDDSENKEKEDGDVKEVTEEKEKEENDSEEQKRIVEDLNQELQRTSEELLEISEKYLKCINITIIFI